MSLLRHAVEYSASDDGWAYLGQMGQHIANQAPEFDPQLRLQKLGDLVRATQLFDVDERRSADQPGYRCTCETNERNNQHLQLSSAICNLDRRKMKRLAAISCLFVLCGCASMHSPYDLRDWCLIMGSSRPADIGPTAQNPATCNIELAEDLADRHPGFCISPEISSWLQLSRPESYGLLSV